MKEIKLSKKTNLLQAAWAANLIPETTEVIEKTKDGVILKGQNLGNYRVICVKVIFEEKEQYNDRLKTDSNLRRSGRNVRANG